MILDICDNLIVAYLIQYIKLAINIIKIVIPIGLIIKVILDIYGNLASGFDNKENIMKKIMPRVTATIIIFLVPTIINLIIALIDNVNSSNNKTSFASCYNQVNSEYINSLKVAIDNELKKEDEEREMKIQTEKAETQAKLIAQEEKRQKEIATAKSTSNYSSTLTDETVQNGVYVKNGTFYKPRYKEGDESTYSGMGCPKDDTSITSPGYNNVYDYNNYFYNMLTSFVEASKKAGYNLGFYDDGCRNYAKQSKFFDTMESGRAAHPGRSNHGWGIAADLIFYKDLNNQCGSSNTRTRDNCRGMAWAHDHAAEFGLVFSQLNAGYREDWHVQPLNIETYYRGGYEK